MVCYRKQRNSSTSNPIFFPLHSRTNFSRKPTFDHGKSWFFRTLVLSSASSFWCGNISHTLLTFPIILASQHSWLFDQKCNLHSLPKPVNFTLLAFFTDVFEDELFWCLETGHKMVVLQSRDSLCSSIFQKKIPC